MNIHEITDLTSLKAQLKSAKADVKSAQSIKTAAYAAYLTAQANWAEAHGPRPSFLSDKFGHYAWESESTKANRGAFDIYSVAYDEVRSRQSAKIVIADRILILESLARRTAGVATGDEVLGVYLFKGRYLIGRKKMFSGRYVAFEVHRERGTVYRAIGPTGDYTPDWGGVIVKAVELPLR